MIDNILSDNKVDDEKMIGKKIAKENADGKKPITNKIPSLKESDGKKNIASKIRDSKIRDKDDVYKTNNSSDNKKNKIENSIQVEFDVLYYFAYKIASTNNIDCVVSDQKIIGDVGDQKITDSSTDSKLPMMLANSNLMVMLANSKLLLMLVAPMES